MSNCRNQQIMEQHGLISKTAQYRHKIKELKESNKSCLGQAIVQITSGTKFRTQVNALKAQGSASNDRNLYNQRHIYNSY